jgi:hypothetical protein
MAEQLTATAAGGTLTAAVTGAWELRAGSHDTTDYLARGGTYPGNIDSFAPLNGDDTTSGDAANGYTPAPKMAIITCANIADSNTVELGGGISAITGAFLTTFTANNGQTAGLSFSGNTVTFEATGAVTSGQLLVFYS